MESFPLSNFDGYLFFSEMCTFLFYKKKRPTLSKQRSQQFSFLLIFWLHIRSQFLSLLRFDIHFMPNDDCDWNIFDVDSIFHKPLQTDVQILWHVHSERFHLKSLPIYKHRQLNGRIHCNIG